MGNYINFKILLWSIDPRGEIVDWVKATSFAGKVKVPVVQMDTMYSNGDWYFVPINKTNHVMKSIKFPFHDKYVVGLINNCSFRYSRFGIELCHLEGAFYEGWPCSTLTTPSASTTQTL